MLSQKTNIHYKWLRVCTDIIVILIGLVVSGGLAAIFRGDISGVKNIGIGTIITAFMMGPLTNFFSKHVSSKILDVDYAGISKEFAFFMLKGAMLKNLPMDEDNSTKLNMSSNAYQVLNEIDF
jgi:hypothetical protein